MAFSLGNHGVRALIRKIRRRLIKPITLQPAAKDSYARLPEGADNISVETVLNSRCSSDYDDKPEISHWGMFDKSTRLSERDIQRIMDHSIIPRFTERKLGIQQRGSELLFTADAAATGTERDWLMVESGMQQQAVSLVCAALGVGSLILNLGLNGKFVSDQDFATVRMQLGPMKPSYDGSYWSSSVPRRERKWLKGNMPDPARKGSASLLSSMKACGPHKMDGAQLDWQSLGQVLWAARGRTPHFYNCSPWGLTIPTWAGKQDITKLYILNKYGFFNYVNWRHRRPTHSIDRAIDNANIIYQKALRSFPPWNSYFILTTNERRSRGFWEVGYQLLNISLQSYALNLRFQINLLADDKKDFFAGFLGSSEPVAIVGFHFSQLPRGKPRGIKSAASKPAAQALARVGDDARYT